MPTDCFSFDVEDCLYYSPARNELQIYMNTKDKLFKKTNDKYSWWFKIDSIRKYNLIEEIWRSPTYEQLMNEIVY